MIELMTSVCLAAVMMTGQPVEETPTQIMVEFQLVEVDLDAKWFNPIRNKHERASIEFEDAGVINLHSGVRARMNSDLQAFFTVGDDSTIGLGPWRYVVGGPNEDLNESPFTVVAAPRILLYDGMPASVTIGHRVEYLEPADEPGTFRVAVTDVHEGIKFGITPVLRPDGSILLEPMTFELHEVIEREDVEGLSIPGVGKPVIESTEREVIVGVGAGQTAVVPIGHRDFAERPLLLLVRPSVVSDQAAQNENAPAETGAPDEGSDSKD